MRDASLYVNGDYIFSAIKRIFYNTDLMGFIIESYSRDTREKNILTESELSDTHEDEMSDRNKMFQFILNRIPYEDIIRYYNIYIHNLCNEGSIIIRYNGNSTFEALFIWGVDDQYIHCISDTHTVVRIALKDLDPIYIRNTEKHGITFRLDKMFGSDKVTEARESFAKEVSKYLSEMDD